MKKYEKAEMKYVELLTEDIMDASANFGEGGVGGAGEGGNKPEGVM